MLAILLTAQLALANDGTPASLHAAVQGEQQDVTLTLSVVKGGEPGMGAVYHLERDGAPLLSSHTFDEAEALSSLTRCRGGAVWDCTDHPELCEDCDQDGTPECNLEEGDWCEEVLSFEVIDECVPPGEQTWVLTAQDWEWFESSVSLTVEDRGLVCEDPPAEITCATGSAPAGLAGLLMGLLGLGALGSRRRRGR